MTNLDSILKSRDITLCTNVFLVKTVVYPVVMYGCVSWTIKKAECWRTDAFELRYWRSLLDYKEFHPVHSKGYQSWILFGRTDVEAETPILWSPDVKNWLIWKDPDANKMDSLEEMDKFLEKYNLPKLNKEEIENLNGPITSTEIKTVIKNLPAKQSSDQMASQVNSTKNLEKS